MLMSFFPRKASFTLAAWLLVSAIANAVEASDDAKVLMSIASVETGGNRLAVGDNKRARGQYQTHKASWEDGNEQLMREGLKTYPWAGWKSALAQDMIASALLRSIRYKLKQRGIYNPSVRQLRSEEHTSELQSH